MDGQQAVSDQGRGFLESEPLLFFRKLPASVAPVSDFLFNLHVLDDFVYRYVARRFISTQSNVLAFIGITSCIAHAARAVHGSSA